MRAVSGLQSHGLPARGRAVRVHDLANELVDAWEAGDRQLMMDLAERNRQHETEQLAREAEGFARWQIRVYKQFRRVLAWRASHKKRIPA